LALRAIDLGGDPFLGVFCIATEKHLFMPPGMPAGNVSALEQALAVPALTVTVGGTRVIGTLIAANSQGVVVQDSYNIRNDRGLSDYDARHRFVVSWLYELPFHSNRLTEGWQLGGITQLQSGNPVNIITSINTFTGVASLRPDVIGEIKTVGTPAQWFTNTAFALPVGPGNVVHFGNLGRNVVIGPGFSNTDFSVLKNTKLTESLRLQFRAEVFDIFNHANFGQPGRVVGTGAFGVISNTRFPTGDSGSSRQIQFAMKLIF